MISLEDYFNKFKLEAPTIPDMEHATKVKLKSQRSELIKELYEFYTNCWKIETYKVYRKWCRDNKKKDIELSRAEFKKTKLFYNKITTRYFAIKLAHIPTSDLYYLISIAKDKKNRRENFNSWLFWSLKVNK